MRKCVFFLLLFSFFICFLPAQEIPSHAQELAEKIAEEENEEDEGEYVPYEVDEFGPGLRSLRRGEVLFFGSLPLTYLYSNLGYMAYSELSGNSLGEEDRTYALLYSSITLSAAVVLIDAIIGLAEN